MYVRIGDALSYDFPGLWSAAMISLISGFHLTGLQLRHSFRALSLCNHCSAKHPSGDSRRLLLAVGDLTYRTGILQRWNQGRRQLISRREGADRYRRPQEAVGGACPSHRRGRPAKKEKCEEGYEEESEERDESKRNHGTSNRKLNSPLCACAGRPPSGLPAREL